MKDVHHSCQGESHIITNKVCQDKSYSAISDSMSIAIVCDGHGGSRYFRSDVGAQFAVEATINCVEAFVKEVDESLFKDKPLIQKLTISSEAQGNLLSKDTDTDKALRQLFSSIIFLWKQKVEEHAKDTPLLDSEIANIDAKYAEDFKRNLNIEKTYGCTLMCYVQTKNYWFAFHIGDGKCIAFDTAGNWSEPVLWDEKCFLNKTTSLCDSSALEEFRYSYQGDGMFPLAVFLGSDGIDDSFGDVENQVNFYIQILKLLSNNQDDAITNIKETLPQLSKIGSKDDMSIACIYDENSLEKCIEKLVMWQQTNVAHGITITNDRILNEKNIIKNLEAKGLSNQKNMIEYQYAQKDLLRAFEQKKQLVFKWNKFAQELHGDDFIPYSDEIGLGCVSENYYQESDIQSDNTSESYETADNKNSCDQTNA